MLPVVVEGMLVRVPVVGCTGDVDGKYGEASWTRTSARPR
jgi:hypothetical protein